MISWLRWVSRLPVGSSASSTAGSVTMARAIATRCCCPPESSAGVWCSQPFRPTASSARAAAAWRRAAGSPRYSSGSSTFSCALVRASRLKPWNTKPKYRRLSRARSSRDSASTCAPMKRYCPPVGRSRQPSRFMAVDLPEPLGPMMATNSPRPMARSTPLSARKAVAPSPYALVMPRSWISGTGCCVALVFIGPGCWRAGR